MKNTKNKSKPDIEYGNVDIPDEAFEARNTKSRVTMFVDTDVVNFFRAEADRFGIGYQTLINQRLRAAVFGEASERGSISLSDFELAKIAESLKKDIKQQIIKDIMANEKFANSLRASVDLIRKKRSRA